MADRVEPALILFRLHKSTSYGRTLTVHIHSGLVNLRFTIPTNYLSWRRYKWNGHSPRPVQPHYVISQLISLAFSAKATYASQNYAAVPATSCFFKPRIQMKTVGSDRNFLAGYTADSGSEQVRRLFYNVDCAGKPSLTAQIVLVRWILRLKSFLDTENGVIPHIICVPR